MTGESAQGGGPLKQMSDTLTEASDIRVTGTDVTVTKGPNVEGNEVTLVLHPEDESNDEVILGFDSSEFEDFVSRVTVGSDRDWEVQDADE